MSETMFISSFENKTIKFIKKLNKKSFRLSEGLFIAEGAKFLDHPLNSKFLLISESFFEKKDKIKDEKIERFDCEKFILKDQILNKLSSQIHPEGIILVYKIPNYELSDIASNIIVLDDLSDPGNLGTIVRTLDAVGLKDIILTSDSVDIYNEKVVRSTMGSIFNIKTFYMDKKDIIEFLTENKNNNYNVLSTSLDKDSISYLNMKLDKKNAFIFGNESKGISKEFIDISSSKINIPIYGNAESLNVGISTGIILYKFRELIS